jgi:hypothetical protein
MKKNIPIPKSLSYLIIGIGVTIAAALLGDAIKSSISWNKELDKFRSLRINSKLYELKNLQRGNYEIKVKHNNALLSFDLPIAYDVETQHIQNGDSLTKETNTGTFNIYRMTNAGVSHICTVNIN